MPCYEECTAIASTCCCTLPYRFCQNPHYTWHIFAYVSGEHDPLHIRWLLLYSTYLYYVLSLFVIGKRFNLTAFALVIGEHLWEFLQVVAGDAVGEDMHRVSSLGHVETR